MREQSSTQGREQYRENKIIKPSVTKAREGERSEEEALSSASHV